MRRSTRRTLLAAASGSLLASAGCLDVIQSDDQPTDASDDPPYALPTDSVDTDQCPTFDAADHVVSSDAVDPDETAIFLEVDSQTVTESEQLTATLRNQTTDEFEYHEDGLGLSKRVDGQWHQLIPYGHPSSRHVLAGERSHEWNLTIDNDDVAAGNSPADTDGETLSGLTSGEYAITARGRFAADARSIGFCTHVTLESTSLEVTPTAAVTETAVDGDTLIAHSDRNDPDAAYTELGAYELHVDESIPADEATTLITETVLRNDQQRDVIALATEYDVSHVRLEEYDATTPLFGTGETGYYEYDDLRFEITTQTLEERTSL